MPVSTIQRLVLPVNVRQDLMVHLLEAAPNEGCGMLGVSTPEQTDTGFIATAAKFIPGRNMEASPTHFTMDPHDVIKAFRQFRDEGLTLGAIVHSHLRGPATPSESDVNEWNYPEALMLIASFAQQPPVLHAWRVIEDNHLMIVQPVEISVVHQDNRQERHA